MEIIDILDENGNKTGKSVTRKEIHEKGYWHRNVYACIVNSKKEILVQKRSNSKDIFPNKIDLSVGGHIASGEEELEAIKREIFEEIGVKVHNEQLEYLFTFSNEYEGKGNIDRHIIDVYLVEIDLDIDKLSLQKEEVTEVKNIYYKDFEKLIEEKGEELITFPKGWKKLCKILDKKYA